MLLRDYKNYEVLEKSSEKTSSKVDSVYFNYLRGTIIGKYKNPIPEEQF